MTFIDKPIEQVLLLRCQTGDKEAFAKLIQLYQQKYKADTPETV